MYMVTFMHSQIIQWVNNYGKYKKNAKKNVRQFYTNQAFINL